jgi:hypothetical protein
MENNIHLIILFIGGFVGWSLFVYTIVSAIRNRNRELKMIDEISIELDKVKEELRSIK